METIKIRVTLQEEMLGMSSADPEIHKKFIASRSGDAEKIKEEQESLPADTLFEKALTVFPRDPDGDPMLWDYQIKGFYKDAIGMLQRVKQSCAKCEGTGKVIVKEEEKDCPTCKGTGEVKRKIMPAYKSVIDGLVFVAPRKIKIVLPKGTAVGLCTRPLRADTPQGPRVCLCTSETVPAGSILEMTIKSLDASIMPHLREALDYGELRGLGQWRNSGKGRFTWGQL